jgi:hypothetical protein
MAASLKYLTFATRHKDLKACASLILHFEAGEADVEYVPASEVQNEDGTWTYGFYINEADLPGSMTLADVRESAVVEPYWSCADTLEEEECVSRNINAFNALEEIETLDGVKVVVSEFDEDCEVFQLKIVDPSLLGGETEAPSLITALVYEAFLPGDEIETGDETYVDHIPDDFMPTGFRISCAEYGPTEQLRVELKINGVSLFTSGSTGEVVPSSRTVAISTSALAAPFVGVPLAGGAELLAKIANAPFNPYAGSNYKGLRVSIIGYFV